MRVKGRAQLHADRAGEPLDGLVNMFDIGIVLAVGFLIAALEALGATQVLTHKVAAKVSTPTLTVKPNQKVEKINKPSNQKIRVKSGAPLGQVYQFPNSPIHTRTNEMSPTSARGRLALRGHAPARSRTWIHRLGGGCLIHWTTRAQAIHGSRARRCTAREEGYRPPVASPGRSGRSG